MVKRRKPCKLRAEQHADCAELCPPLRCAIGGHRHLSDLLGSNALRRSGCAELIHEEDEMNRRVAAGLATIAVAGFAFQASPASSQQKSLKDQLIGTWTLVSWVQSNKDGSKYERFGANPKGVNMFSPDGHFSLIFERPDLPKIASSDPAKPSAEEANAITVGSIAYFGTYTVDEASKMITLQIEGTTLANQLGMAQKRTIKSLTANELTYTNPTAVTGASIDVSLKRAQ
jgi:Lipocalin-like domain